MAKDKGNYEKFNHVENNKNKLNLKSPRMHSKKIECCELRASRHLSLNLNMVTKMQNRSLLMQVEVSNDFIIKHMEVGVSKG
jgi:hypothetical protein